MNHCLPIPANDRYIIRHKWQVDFCEGNTCAAELISYFASWHDIRLNQSEKSKYANNIAQTHGDQGGQDESLFQFHSQEELKIALHGAYSIETIRKAIVLLGSKAVISRHCNPNPRYRFDKTTYYLFNSQVCIDYVDSLKIGNGRQPSQAREQENRPAITYDSTYDKDNNNTTADISESRKTANGKKGAKLLPEPLIQPRDADDVFRDVESFVSLYNSEKPERARKITVITPARREKYTKYMTMLPSVHFWWDTIRELHQSKFLLGLNNSNGHQSFCADLDWLCQTGKDGIENCIKTHEKKYNDQVNNQQPEYVYDWQVDTSDNPLSKDPQ